MAASDINLRQVDPRWAWAAYQPSPDAPWDLPRAAHLFRRAAFGASWDELQRALDEGPAKTLDRLFAGGEKKDEFYQSVFGSARTLKSNVENLPAWWLYVMLHSPHPLLEKMTLFWHGHFATSAAKVENGPLMFDQHKLLRTHALGKFRPLVEGMAKDPAMLLWLDSATNKKAKPNENFAREVMELFCLGLDNYTERDIKEAARAFTGWEVRYEKFVFNRHQHDDGAKTLLGQTGRFNGEDVIRILLEQPAAGQFLCGKLFRYFVSETEPPPPELLAPVAEGYRRHDYSADWLLRTMLGSNLFFSPHAVHRKVKAPVEMAIGLLRPLEATTNTYALAEDLRKLGQGVFHPPNVKGWDGGREWINSSTLLSRINVVWAIVSGRDGRYKKKVDLEKWSDSQGLDDSEKAVRRLADVLLGTPLPGEVYRHLTNVAEGDKRADNHLRLARVVHAIAALPEFHVV